MSNKVIPKLMKGDLVKYGYHLDLSMLKRHDALNQAIQEYGALSVFRKLNALYVLNKNRANGNLFKKDRDWIRKSYQLGKIGGCGCCHQCGS